jgi:glycosyltransferase involved in cell wall biosynthesis
MKSARAPRLAIVVSHPIQYYAPWFRFMSTRGEFALRIFHLWDFGAKASVDRKFGTKFAWDIDLLSGYESEFVPNVSRDPGTHHFFGLKNPELNQRVGEFAPDTILLFGYKYWSHFRLLLWARRRGIPVIFRGDSHRLGVQSSPADGPKQLLLRAVFRLFSAFLYVGQANRAYLREHGVRDEQLFFAPHAVDNERFLAAAPQAAEDAKAWRCELGIPEAAVVALFAGKFEPKKRTLDLLEAFRRADVPGSALLLVGSGALEAELREKARGMANVFFAPFQNQSLMPRTYAAGDVFVLPSFGNGETWGLAVNEAMCLCRPVIVSDHVGCAADLVMGQDTGWVFPAADGLRLSFLLKNALESREVLGSMGYAARERVRAYSYLHAAEGLSRAVRSEARR